MEAYQERVVAEKDEANDRMEKLKAFLFTDTFRALPVDEQGRLVRQEFILQLYVQVLVERIAAFN